MATPKSAVLALPDVGLSEEQVQSLKEELKNQILGTLVKAGVPIDVQIENSSSSIPRGGRGGGR